MKKRGGKKESSFFSLSTTRDQSTIRNTTLAASVSLSLSLSLSLFNPSHLLERRDTVGRVIHQPRVQVGHRTGQVLEVDVEAGAAGRHAAGHAEQGADLGGVEASSRCGGGVPASALGVEERGEIAFDGEASLRVAIHLD